MNHRYHVLALATQDSDVLLFCTWVDWVAQIP